jgi:ankyrin repeat protein
LPFPRQTLPRVTPRFLTQICERRPCAALDANEYGDTPAHLAAAAGRLPAVYLLTEKRPELLAADNNAGKVGL